MKRKQNDHIIVAVHVTDRVKQAGRVQTVFTEYGANIKTRVGLHEATGRAVAPNGVIVLEMVGSKRKCLGILDVLNALKGVEAKPVVFEH